MCASVVWHGADDYRCRRESRFFVVVARYARVPALVSGGADDGA